MYLRSSYREGTFSWLIPIANLIWLRDVQGDKTLLWTYEGVSRDC